MVLATRVVVPELMDAHDLDPRAHAQALVGLRRLNALAASHRLVADPVLRIAREQREPMTIVDLACGGGDTAIALAQLARAQHVALTVRGLDCSPTAIELASAAASRAGLDVAFECANVLGVRDLGFTADVVTCSLFLHHTAPEHAALLLSAMARAARSAIVVVDLLRTRVGLALAAVAAQLVTRSPIVHFDATASVRAAFTVDEVRALARNAGLERVTIERVWPQRFRLVARHA